MTMIEDKDTAQPQTLAERIRAARDSYGPRASLAHAEAEKESRESEEAKNTALNQYYRDMELLRQFERLHKSVKEAEDWLTNCKNVLRDLPAAQIAEAYDGLVQHCSDGHAHHEWIAPNVFQRIASAEVVKKHTPELEKRLEAAITQPVREELQEFIDTNAELLKKHSLI